MTSDYTGGKRAAPVHRDHDLSSAAAGARVHDHHKRRRVRIAAPFSSLLKQRHEQPVVHRCEDGGAVERTRYARRESAGDRKAARREEAHEPHTREESGAPLRELEVMDARTGTCSVGRVGCRQVLRHVESTANGSGL